MAKAKDGKHPVPPEVDKLAAAEDAQLEALEQQQAQAAAESAPEPAAQAQPEAQPEAAKPAPQAAEPVAAEPQAEPVPDPSKVDRKEYERIAGELKKLRQEQQSWLGRQQKEIDASKLQDKLEQLKTELREEYAKAQQPVEPQMPAHLANLTAEERQAYENEPLPPEARMAQGMVSATERRLRSEIEAMKAQHAEEMKAISEARQKADAQSNEAKVWDAVNELRAREGLPPNAHLFETQPEIQPWLQERDPDNVFGKTRGEVGWGFVESGDVASLHKFVLDGEKQTVASDDEAVPAEVAAQVKPAPVRGQARPTTTQKPIINADAIRYFIQRSLDPNGTPVDLDGRPIPGTRSEALKRVDEIQEEIELAWQQGRVRGGLDGSLARYPRR
jgi:hypothetical protein